MTCPNDDVSCDIKKQLELKRQQELKEKPKTVKYFMGFRSKAWVSQYLPKENNKC